MCIVAIYEFWAGKFRKEIASMFGVNPDDFKHDLFGDIRHIRNVIIHKKSIADSNVENCTMLKWFKMGEEIAIDDVKMESLVFLLRDVCKKYSTQLSNLELQNNCQLGE